jgi:hypothetical protein
LITGAGGLDGGVRAATDLGRRTQGAWNSLGTGVDGSAISLNDVSLGKEPLLASSSLILAWIPVTVFCGEKSPCATTGKDDKVDLAGRRRGAGLSGL